MERIRIRGTRGDDTITGTEHEDNIKGLAGDDRIEGRGGNDLIAGGPGADVIDGGDGPDRVVYADSEAAVIVNLEAGTGSGGEAEGDRLISIENIRGSAHDDTLTGNDGDNRIEGGPGADIIDGKGNSKKGDWAVYSDSEAGVTVNLNLKTGQVSGGDAKGDTLINIENIRGSEHDDTLTGDDGNNRIEGGAGEDTIDGGDGKDWAIYERSNAGVTVDLNLKTGQVSGGHAAGDILTNIENIHGSEYNDKLIGDDGKNHLHGGLGNDTLQGGVGADYLHGGAGVDEASYDSSGARVIVNLAEKTASGGDATGDTLTNIENILGSKHDDILTGNDGDNRLRGGDGIDTLNGGAGNDTLEGGEGDDVLRGGVGVDEASYASSNDGVMVNLMTGQVSGGHAAGDTLTGIENIRGSAHDDLLKGDDVKNVIKGGAGNDRIYGQGGDDTLEGGAGADVLHGGYGADEAAMPLPTLA